MKPRRLLPLSVSVPLLLASVSPVQVGTCAEVSALQLTPPSAPARNRVGLSYRPGYNITASFTGIGGFPALSNPGFPVGGDLDRTYDDGYNLRDISPADGLTWNWGYVEASQIVNGSLLLSSSSATPASGASQEQDGAQQGVELTYRRRLGEPSTFLYGLEAAFNFTGIKLRDSRPVASTVSRLTDAYDLGGIIPPQAPPPDWAYQGTALGPGPLITDAPFRRSLATLPGALTTGQRSLEASLYGLRLGPYIELPFWKRCAFSLSGGLALALVDSEYEIDETTALAGVGTVAHSGRDTQSEMLAGVYVAGTLSVSLTRAIDLAVGAQYQHLESFTQRIGASQVELNLDRSVFFTAGLGFSF